MPRLFIRPFLICGTETIDVVPDSPARAEAEKSSLAGW